MQYRTYVIGAALILFGIVAVWFLSDQNRGTGPSGSAVELADPVDVVADFYSAWLSAVRSTSTDPHQSELTVDPSLSTGMRARLENLGTDVAVDPVLCQAVVPERIRTKSVFVTEDSAQILVMPRGEGVTKQSLVALAVIDGAWQITDITCTDGESAPERAFDFEREGYLLKDSVPPPLDSQYWHLVFEENGQAGHTAPLFFDASSICIAPDESESTCDPSQFTEAAKVRVQGDMSESGATVKRLQFLE